MQKTIILQIAVKVEVLDTFSIEGFIQETAYEIPSTEGVEVLSTEIRDFTYS